MANSKETKKLIEKKISELSKVETDQIAIVNNLNDKLAKINNSYDAAADKLSGIQKELNAYKADKDK